MAEFQTSKSNYAEYRIVSEGTPSADDDVAAGDILVRVTQFAFTANNITYAVAGDMIGYWQFFPPHGDSPDGWGIIPVWGFAEVVRSGHPDIPVGDKLFGYFPPADVLRMTPGNVSAATFDDAIAHRASLPPLYNRYRRVGAEAGYDSALDAERMLLWPLYATGFCLADALLLNDWYGAEQVLVLSASSKTSIGMGYALRDIPGAATSIGLTSSRNEAFVKDIGVYDRVCNYDELTAIDSNIPTAIVDMSGNRALLGALHERLGDNMKFTINVGITHWDQGSDSDKIISERSEMFFAPGHMQKRAAEWGVEGFDQRSTAFVHSGIERSRAWLKLSAHHGLDGLAEIYADVCSGSSSPQEGQIIKMS